jgi:hypothetical protein|tara:strand:- start:123 stop:1139 length:1017 start_codon:yes stop_codon:yes gene_type:complete
MVRKDLVKLIALIFLLSFFMVGQVKAACGYTGTKLTIDASDDDNPVLDDGTASDSCGATPDEYSISFHGMGLCTSNPDVAGAEPDYSSCSYMIAPTETLYNTVITGIGEETVFTPTPPAFEFPVGTYSYMVGIVSAKLGIKHTFEGTAQVKTFSDTSTSDTAAYAAPGLFCWTVDNQTAPGSPIDGPVLTGITNENNILTPFGRQYDTSNNNQSNLRCADTAGTAAFSYEVVNAMDDNNCASYAADGDRSSMGAVNNGIAVGRLLQNNTTSATNCTNADRILWTIALTTPLTVTPTSTFVMNMKATNSVSIDFAGAHSSTAVISKVGADPIEVYLSTD